MTCSDVTDVIGWRKFENTQVSSVCISTGLDADELVRYPAARQTEVGFARCRRQDAYSRSLRHDMVSVKSPERYIVRRNGKYGMTDVAVFRSCSV